MERLKKKGIAFDLDGDKWTLDQLMEVDGLLPLKDIADRLPFSRHRMRMLRTKPGEFNKCFYHPCGDGVGDVFIDLKLFNEITNKRLEKPYEAVSGGDN